MSTPCIFPKISRRSKPVACSRSVGTVPGSAPGGSKSCSVLISMLWSAFCCLSLVSAHHRMVSAFLAVLDDRHVVLELLSLLKHVVSLVFIVDARARDSWLTEHTSWCCCCKGSWCCICDTERYTSRQWDETSCNWHCRRRGKERGGEIRWCLSK